ncbi:MAG TPA: CAP domain-containing protein [Dehalococcoidia bacterium]|nr:CAP domain-containing protein [Dehalococcoidia bacterium]
MLRKLLAPIGAALVLIAAATTNAALSDEATATTPLTTEETTLLALINNYRQQNGLTALAIDTKLQDASEWMSLDMGANAYFSHTDSLGRDPIDRMSAFGYTYTTWKGENLAAGTSSAQKAFDLWKASSGHNGNMLGAYYRVVGIARRYTAGSPYGWYWTTDYGGYASPSPAPTTPGALPGDADCNETVNAIDGLKVLRFVAGLGTSSCVGATDVDCSGTVDSVDALDILRFVAGLQQTGLPEDCPGITAGA